MFTNSPIEWPIRILERMPTISIGAKYFPSSMVEFVNNFAHPLPCDKHAVLHVRGWTIS